MPKPSRISPRTDRAPTLVRPAGLVATALLAVAATLLVPAPAYAADITVTTTVDVTVADAEISLREAITQANGAGEDSTITLAPGGLYTLDDCGGADEEGNVDGDLDYTADDVLTINGNGATISQSCPGERILDSLHGDGAVTINNATVTSGEGIGAALIHTGDLSLNGVTVSGNDAGAGNAVVDNEGMGFTPVLTVTNSTIGPNTGSGIRISFGTVNITDSSVSNNTVNGVGLTDGALTVTDATFENNGSAGVSTSGQGNGLFRFTNSISRNNGGVGVRCNNCGDLRVVGSSVAGNDGGGIDVVLDLDEATDDLTILIENSTVQDNTHDGDGGALEVTAPMPLAAASATVLVTGSTLSGNTATGDGGAIAAEQADVRIVNSTIVDNEAQTSGGAIAADASDLHLQHATIVDNGAPAGGHLAGTANLFAFASILTGASGDDACDLSGVQTSLGYNLAGDTSCGLTAAGDLQNVADPGLGPLQDGGGPTPTRAPLAGSPPWSACPSRRARSSWTSAGRRDRRVPTATRGPWRSPSVAATGWPAPASRSPGWSRSPAAWSWWASCWSSCSSCCAAGSLTPLVAAGGPDCGFEVFLFIAVEVTVR